MHIRICFAVICTTLLGLATYAQSDSIRIELKNGSFEFASMHPGIPPSDWLGCCWGERCDETRSTPDVHDGKGNLFEVSDWAKTGKRFLGLVTRDDATSEGITQELMTPLIAGQQYIVELYAKQTRKFVSTSRTTGKLSNFEAPVVLVFAAGTQTCEIKEILAVSEVIQHNEWKKYTFEFTPKASDLRYFSIFVDFVNADGPFENGHVLLDGLSDLLLLQ